MKGKLALSGNISQSGMALLFPGFLFYHFFSGYFLLHLPLAGFFGPTAAFFAVICIATLSISVLRKATINFYEFLVFLFFLYVLIYTGIHFLISSGDDYVRRAVVQSLESWVLCFTVFFMAYWFPKEIGFTKRIFFSTLILTALFLGWYLYETGNLMFYVTEDRDADHISTYQGFARSVLVISLILLASTSRVIARFAVFVASIFVLFLLGARSEFLVFLLASLAFVAALCFREVKTLLIFCISLAFLALVLIGYVDFEVFSESRHFQLLDISSASSWIEREEFKETAIYQIQNSPLLGYFGGHIAHYGIEGAYSHDLFSAWANYGFFGFFIYMLLILVPLIHSVIIFITNKSITSEWQLVFLFSIAIFILVGGAKSVFFVLTPLAWGFYARIFRLNNDALKKIKAQHMYCLQGK